MTFKNWWSSKWTKIFYPRLVGSKKENAITCHSSGTGSLSFQAYHICLLISGPSLLTQSKTNNYSELPVVPCWRDISWYSSEVVSKFSSVTPSFTKIQSPAGVNNKHTPLFTCVHPYNHLRSLARLLLHPNISEGNYYLTLTLTYFLIFVHIS